MEQTDELIELPNIRQIYAQEHVQQLRDHIGAVTLNRGYIGELQMIGRGPVGTTPLKESISSIPVEILLCDMMMHL